jgi:membrane associated rhomboid family serine protease
LAESLTNDSIKIHPWVSYLLSVLLLAGSFGILLTSPDAAEEAGNSPAMLDARHFFERNPSVELSEQLARWIGPDHIATVRAEHERRRDRGAVAVLSQRMRDKTQKRFEAIQQEAFASLKDLPSWRLGVVDASSGISNTFAHVAVHESLQAIIVSLLFFVLAAITLEAAWGTPIFAAFCLLLPFVSATTYTSLYGEQGIPWIGASGVVAGLLGAYLIRSLKGFTIPAWILLPVWILAEYLVARDLPIDRFDAAPVVVHLATFAFGAGFAALVWVLGLEDKLQMRQEEVELVSNPLLEQALMERDHGNIEAAFELLEAGVRREPGNHDLAVALWQVASGSERAGRALPALLASVRDALRSGRREDACAIWNDLTRELGSLQAESTLLVRIGEALLAEEQHDAAVGAFAEAVDGPKTLSSVLALRVVRGSRDLDPGLAARAAAVALIDDQLGASERATLQAVLDRVQASGAAAAPEVTLTSESLVAPDAPSLTPELTPAPPSEPDPLQDPHAIAAEAFAELGEGESLAAEDPEEWNQPGVVGNLSAEAQENGPGFDWSGLDDTSADININTDTPAGLGGRRTEPAAKAASDVSETTETLEPADSFSAAISAGEADLPFPELAETNASNASHATKREESEGSEESDGSEMAGYAGPAIVHEDMAPASLAPEHFTEPVLHLEAPAPELLVVGEQAVPELAPDSLAAEGPIVEQAVVAGDSSSKDLEIPMLDEARRVLLARAAVPVALDAEGLSVEVDGGAKTVLPYARIEAVAAGAVSGLADKPVLVVDIVLNWLDVADEPLKVVRLRSDGFDPRMLMPGRDSALGSLCAMLDQLLASSGATPLPDRSAALGDPFASFESIESYDRNVLMTR